MDVALEFHGGNPEAARGLFNNHVKDGLFTHAGDYLKWSGAFTKVENREMTATEETKMTEMLYGIYTDKVKIGDIISSTLPSKAQRQLLSELRTKQTQDRTLSAQENANENRPFQNHAFKEQESWIEAQFAKRGGILDKFDDADNFILGARATAKLELAEHVRKNGLEGIRDAAVVIAERHKERVKMFDERQLDLAAKTLRYNTPAEVRANAHLLTDQDLALHILYFENRNKPKPKPAKGK